MNKNNSFILILIFGFIISGYGKNTGIYPAASGLEIFRYAFAERDELPFLFPPGVLVTNGIKISYNPVETNELDIVFTGIEKIDRIAFVNGTTNGCYPVEKMILISYTNNFNQDGIEDIGITSSNEIKLKNNGELQHIFFPETVKASGWKMLIHSVYTDIGVTNSGYTGLKGLEFFYKDDKLEFTNLNETIGNLTEKVIRKKSELIHSFFGKIREVNFERNPEYYLDKWFGLLDYMEEINYFLKKNNFVMHLEFENTDRKEGKILCGKVNGVIRKEKDPVNTAFTRYFFNDAYDLGMWRLDEQGYFWIKIGRGQWKKETGTFLSFKGTDLEGVTGIADPEF